jgi:DNA polymerase V
MHRPKMFFASVEALDRGLDPFETNLVVADPSRGNGAICLAITPAMKKLGVKNRCRIFEIPKNLEYLTALPRMKLYMDMSAKIYSIYLKYVSADDIHVYSIDECFIDATHYLKIYNKTAKEFAQMLMNAVMKETGVCATAGIGTNLFLAKVALDITAKHVPDNIGNLDEEEFKKQIWKHRPITDIWNIGNGIANRLAKYGVHDLYGVTKMNEQTLYREFGVNAEFLIDHAKGIEPCTISDIHNYKSKNNSISNGQILFDDYNYDDAFLVLKEMIDVLVLELIEKNLVTNNISLFIGYSKDVHPSTGGSKKLKKYTSSYKEIIKEFEELYKTKTAKDYPIRKINVGLNNIVDEDAVCFQLDLFSDVEQTAKERNVQEAVLNIKNKFGKNAVLRGISLEKKSTAKIRNKLVGGHNGE